MINIDLHIIAQQRKTLTEYLKKSFRMYVSEDFIRTDTPKKHTLLNHVYRFKRSIWYTHQKETNGLMMKRSLYYVDYGINVWTEINGLRPSLVFKNNDFKYWEDTIVIPLTSYAIGKSLDTFDVKISPNATNNLKNDSLLKIRQLRMVSKKRIQQYIWKITDNELKDLVQQKVLLMLWIHFS